MTEFSDQLRHRKPVNRTYVDAFRPTDEIAGLRVFQRVDLHDPTATEFSVWAVIDSIHKCLSSRLVRRSAAIRRAKRIAEHLGVPYVEK